MTFDFDFGAIKIYSTGAEVSVGGWSEAESVTGGVGVFKADGYYVKISETGRANVFDTVSVCFAVVESDWVVFIVDFCVLSGFCRACVDVLSAGWATSIFSAGSVADVSAVGVLSGFG